MELWKTPLLSRRRVFQRTLKIVCVEKMKLLPNIYALIFLAGLFANCTKAQTVDLSTNEAVIAELQKIVDAKRAEFEIPGNPELDAKIKDSDTKLKASSIRIKRFKDVPEVIVIGTFRTEYGFRLSGVFVNSRYFEKDEADLTKNALATLGWEKMPKREREMLADFWVTKCLLAFSDVRYTKDKDFNGGEFQPPRTVSTENGGIKVTLWIIASSGMMSRGINFKFLEYRFTKDGDLSGDSPSKP